ncbi:hypothetical protein [Xenorhabdus griffiniae]|uniref:Uncharacterized protein n=1 Tax=Xenorhabdus griffiniae TaxID=351672 RepID=A0ABY9XL05_9GAMM|nr:hypothetical protein [Xenorhabdus griffiniae]MBD1229235.1 hypothetical protein [Xenorhabdus griffiniae]MBE8588992.1 hypothetical protein [Xenorhabdus griffiniae]WMV73509.1 hypothetical protein QL128_05660 [Xenorhabdus griffiniae]WNH03189.1 hypothetical protein QL112_005665 [Xenorhabdus griffiniae]
MTEQEKLDADARRLIERNNQALLRIISKICLIKTSNENDEHDRQEALRIAKHQNTEIEFFLLEQDAGNF